MRDTPAALFDFRAPSNNLFNSTQELVTDFRRSLNSCVNLNRQHPADVIMRVSRCQDGAAAEPRKGSFVRESHDGADGEIAVGSKLGEIPSSRNVALGLIYVNPIVAAVRERNKSTQKQLSMRLRKTSRWNVARQPALAIIKTVGIGAPSSRGDPERTQPVSYSRDFNA